MTKVGQAHDSKSLAALPARTESISLRHPIVPSCHHPVSLLAEGLANEMAQRWRDGERPLTEHFLERFPELREHPEAAVDLIYEEVCLRQEHAEPLDPQAILRRFPDWQAQLRVLLECHRILEPHCTAAVFPEVGATIDDCKLLAELGRGAQGRVFLATQTALADRPVVLKLTPCTGREHLSLARLQHTHIVPLYTAHDDAERNLRTLCMPYFGGATLSRLLEALDDRPAAERTGQHLVQALDQAQRNAPLSVPAKGTLRRLLSRLTYVEAICTIGIRLAGALQYAHERGLLHLDLKPSNVLLAADGEPMLLDFHLAREPLRPDSPPPDWFGGTPAYMPREQQAALAAISEGRRVAVSVDGRADVYALGVILYESLGGRHPYLPRVSPPLHACNPRVSVGLSDVIHKCLAYEARERYPDAAMVADDLRRHLTDLPLRGVRNRSLRERWRKWQRRGFSRYVVGNMVAIGMLLIVALGVGAWRFWETEQVGASAERVRIEAMHAQRAQDLHNLTDRLRFLSEIDLAPSPELAKLDATCHQMWARRGELGKLSEEQSLREDLLDFALCWCAVHVRPAGSNPVRRRDALGVLDEAEQLCGPNPILAWERGLYAGVADSGEPPAQSTWEHTALVRSYLRRGDWKRASPHLEKALRLEPHGLWPNFYQGLCCRHSGREQEAVEAFSVCIGAAPECSRCFDERAQAYAALGRTRAARADWQSALANGATPAAMHCNLARIALAEGEKAVARGEIEQALASDPAYRDAHTLLERVQR